MPDHTTLKIVDRIRLPRVPQGDIEQRERELREGAEDAGWTAGVILPSRWSIEGLDSMTWRGGAFTDALTPSLALLMFSAVFATIALARFRWETD